MKKRILIGVGFLLSGIFLAYALRQIEWRAFADTLGSIDVIWLPAYGAVVLIGSFVRTVKWRLISGLPAATNTHFWHSFCLGVLGNLIYPLRAGEIVRVGVVYKYTSLSMAQSTASSVLDRILDILGLSLIVVTVITIHGMQVLGLGSGKAAILATPVVLLTGIAAFVIWGGRLQGVVDWISSGLPGALRERLPRWYRQAVEIAELLHDLRRSLLLILLIGLAFSLDYLGFWLLFHAFGWTLPVMAAITLGAFLQVGASLPSAPSFIGIYQVAAITALGLYGIDKTSALAYSFLPQLLNLFMFSILGGWSLRHLGLHMSALRKEDETGGPNTA